MSDLETLKAQRPICPEPGCGRPMFWTQDDPADEDRYWKCPATPEQHHVAYLESKLQQHEATIAELNTRLAASREATVQGLQHEQAIRSDLAAAQATIQQQARELEEADWMFAFMVEIAGMFVALESDSDEEKRFAAGLQEAIRRHSARAQQDKSEAKKEE